MLITMLLSNELGFLNTLSKKRKVLFIKYSQFRVGKSTDKLNPIVGNRIHYICLGISIFHLNCSHAIWAFLSSRCRPDISTWVPQHPLPNLFFLQLASLCKCYHYVHNSSNMKSGDQILSLLLESLILPSTEFRIKPHVFKFHRGHSALTTRMLVCRSCQEFSCLGALI